MAVARHVNFVSLGKACGLPGCPICRLVSERTERYLDNLLFEHVSDRGFRAAHREAGGFCPEHSRDLSSFRDGLAVAILGRDLLEDRIAAFKKSKMLKKKARCPICVERERIETEFLTFLALADDAATGDGASGNASARAAARLGGRSMGTDDEQAAAELRAAFESSAGLCAPHYETLLAVAKKVPRWLRDFHERRFDELLKRTSVFIDLSAYGRQAEFAALSEADKTVWKELADFLRGGPVR